MEDSTAIKTGTRMWGLKQEGVIFIRDIAHIGAVVGVFVCLTSVDLSCKVSDTGQNLVCIKKLLRCK